MIASEIFRSRTTRAAAEFLVRQTESLLSLDLIERVYRDWLNAYFRVLDAGSSERAAGT